MAKAKLAFTSGAELLWDGALRPDFRDVASGIVGSVLSDDAWQGLCDVVGSYAVLLALEHEAVGLSEQVAAVDKASVACVGLIEALELIQTPRFGGLLGGLVSDKWEEGRGRQRDAEHNQRAMAADIDAVDALGAVERDDNPDAPRLGSALVRAWLEAGRLDPVTDGRDFLVLLWEMQEALKSTAAELRSGRLYKRVQGEAFTEFVGRLDDWQALHGFGLGVSKASASGRISRLSRLVKAIVGEVPLLLDDDGKPQAKQIRRHIHTDAALDEAVLIARTEYRAHQ